MRSQVYRPTPALAKYTVQARETTCLLVLGSPGGSQNRILMNLERLTSTITTHVGCLDGKHILQRWGLEKPSKAPEEKAVLVTDPLVFASFLPIRPDIWTP